MAPCHANPHNSFTRPINSSVGSSTPSLAAGRLEADFAVLATPVTLVVLVILVVVVLVVVVLVAEVLVERIGSVGGEGGVLGVEVSAPGVDEVGETGADEALDFRTWSSFPSSFCFGFLSFLRA